MTKFNRKIQSLVPDNVDDPFPEFVGASPAIVKLKSTLKKIARSDTSVLILGESGTGKELIARAIHELSDRASSRCVEVNCGAIPLHLVESELFGHEKGAFTSAMKKRIGRLEAADTGTLFLDEIGELPLEQQVHFLRFLEEGTFERVGSTERMHVDVRLVAATHVDLEEAVKSGAFREDLFYRINVMTLRVPPLRKRLEDIELLANTFLQKVLKKDTRMAFSKDAIDAMHCHPWPGNVRELQNKVRCAALMCDSKWITPEDLNLDKGKDSTVPSLAQARNCAERDAIEKSLVHSGNNVSRAARILQVSRLTLYRLMEKHDIAC